VLTIPAKGSGGMGPVGFGTAVLALAVHNEQLVAGGMFTTAGGMVCNNIASWDGSSWQPLGSGMGPPGNVSTGPPDVSALIVYNGQLVAGGVFTTAGGVACSAVASWDGSSWHPLGSGMGTTGAYAASVTALTVFNGQLVAGGLFTTAGGTACNCIASWNGSNWQPLGTGMGSSSGGYPNVVALGVYNGELVAGGSFTTAGGVTCNGIASWNGSSWQPLASGMNDDVIALIVYNEQLVAGGFFTTAGGVTCNYIASWDGSSWHPLGGGMGGDQSQAASVYALSVSSGQLVAGGTFATAGGVACSHIATWNGSSWQPLGSGTDAQVSALSVYNGQLVAGGWFTKAEGVTCNYIAQFTKSGCGNHVGAANLGVAYALCCLGLAGMKWGRRTVRKQSER
jgi:hypothetical protein